VFGGTAGTVTIRPTPGPPLQAAARSQRMISPSIPPAISSPG
jgi:hypothetical protein